MDQNGLLGKLRKLAEEVLSKEHECESQEKLWDMTDLTLNAEQIPECKVHEKLVDMANLIMELDRLLKNEE